MASLAAHTWAALAVVGGLAVPAAAEPYQLGGFLGPRWFSDDAALGAKDTYRTTLETGAAFGPRLSRPLYPWLVPELELALSPTTTRDLDVSVFWIEPRVHARFLWPREKLRPFAVLGAGVPMTASSKRGIYGSDVTWETYGGIGAQFSPGRALSFRFDVRVGVSDGFESPIAVDVEATAGLFIELEGGARRSPRREPQPGPRDGDGDGIVDADDRCLDRAEDEDSFEDRDGCPDIDNDLDRVLDIADRCPAAPESYNGFEDEDGCQDSVPGELNAILGTIEGLLYNPGATAVPGSARKALTKIAAVLDKQSSVRLLVVGHTDDREIDVPAVEGESPEDVAQHRADALTDLGVQRALAVKEALVDIGIPARRIDTAGAGAAEPVSDNDKPRGRLRNRRVELRLYIPPR